MSVILALALALGLGSVLVLAAPRMRPPTGGLVEQIDALLPQTQCAKCGYPGCRPYAAAIAAGEVDINRCPPGGAKTIAVLGDLLHRPRLPLAAGLEPLPTGCVAVIDEALCIGCTLCIKACPVDAILGASKHMHTVIASQCTGCELCVEPCPVDCIAMRAPAHSTPDEAWVATDATS